MYVLHWKKRMIMGRRITLDWKHSTMFNGKYYYEIEIEDDIIDFDNKIGDKHVVVLFLPRISQNEDDIFTYCIVSSDWRSI